MSPELQFELAEFNRFVTDRLADRPPLSLEEAMDLWRDEQSLSEPSDDDVAAVREALEEMDRGVPGIPLDEFDRRFRERHGLPPRA